MIGHDEICSLIPHTGKMCLLDTVIDWDESSIECESNSHRLADNPLRSEEGLWSINLVEYGAQAMAVHGALLARTQGRKLAAGYLAALRDVQLTAQDVSRIESPLRIRAENLMAQGGNLIYAFRVSVGDECIVQGRATVVEVSRPESGAE